jgi:hypothetical protein
MGILRVSSSFNFEKKIKSFCQPPRYELSKLEDGLAFVVVHPHASEKIDEHVLMIRDVDDIVQFSMPSHIMVPPDQRIPHHLSTALLQLNSESLMGFWSLQGTDNEDIAFIFTYDNNVSKMLLNKNLFDEIVTDMLESCRALYQLIEEVEQLAERGDENEPTLPGENSEH